MKPVLHQDPNYFCVDSVKFEVQQPAKKDDYQMRRIEVVCQCEKTQEPKPVEKCENDRFRISKLEPGVQYTVTATAHYPNEQSVSDTKSFEIPICNGKYYKCVHKNGSHIHKFGRAVATRFEVVRFDNTRTVLMRAMRAH